MMTLIDEATKVRTVTLYHTNPITQWWHGWFINRKKDTRTIDT